MLMIARREGEVLELSLSPKIDPKTPVVWVIGRMKSPIFFSVPKFDFLKVDV